MILEIKIPSPGESITEALLAAWFVQEGDYVEKDKELAEIESDKATLPLIASESGKIHLLFQTGQTVAIGSVACTIDTSAERPVVSEKKMETQIKSTVPIEQKISVKNETQSSVKSASTPEPAHVKISPVARNMMQDAELTVEDVLSGIKRIGKSEVEAVLGLKESLLPEQELIASSRKKMTPLRKKLAERLVAAKNQTAMLTTFNEIDMSTVMALRKKHQQAFESKFGIKLGFMSFFAKASSHALALFPNVNSMIDGEDIITPGYQDIAIAVQTDKGLMVPVLRNVRNLSIAEIEKGIADLAAKARTGRISIEEMTGGTFTITNGGVFGSLFSTPIINPPQSAILGMHNIIERPIALNGQVVIRPMMYVALSYDHRIIDGKDSVSFLVKIKQMIENPVMLALNGSDPEKLLLAL